MEREVLISQLTITEVSAVAVAVVSFLLVLRLQAVLFIRLLLEVVLMEFQIQ